MSTDTYKCLLSVSHELIVEKLCRAKLSMCSQKRSLDGVRHSRFLLISGRGICKSSVSIMTSQQLNIVIVRSNWIDRIVQKHHQKHHQRLEVVTMSSKTLSDVKNKARTQPAPRNPRSAVKTSTPSPRNTTSSSSKTLLTT